MKLLFSIMAFITASSSYAQTQLWGMTSGGGKNRAGVIFKTDSSGGNYNVEYNFLKIDGANPQYTHMIQANDRMLYGMTSGSGTTGSGIIFQFNPANSHYIKKFDFGGIDGSTPNGSLLQASDGMLYGMTSNGGIHDGGVFFQYDPATSTYIKRYDFDTINGAYPNGSLIQANNGMLYGMTTYGGVNKRGVIFQYNPITSIYTKLFDFDSINGVYPYGSLTQASDGMLYGMTSSGGSKNLGTLFQFNIITSIYIKKIDFDGKINGNNPYGSLIQANDGMLYGMTFSSQDPLYHDGVIFQFNPANSTCTQKFYFNGYFSGANPYGSLIQANDGMLYGLTSKGGVYDEGVLFQYDLATATYSKKIDFNSYHFNGYYPYGSLMQANDGMLYGLTNSGGTHTTNYYESGVLFQYNPTTSTYVNKLYFDLSTTGATPCSSLIQASDGMLYGTTNAVGSSSDTAVLFQYNPTTSKYTSIKIDLSGFQGSFRNPGSLMQANDGMLYGVEPYSVNGSGIIFQYNPATSLITLKKIFDGSTSSNPCGSLIQASDGMLYGITSGLSGSPGHAGGIFQYNPVTASYIEKFSFPTSYPYGYFPHGSLIQADDGMLYGMTTDGGINHHGVLFQYNPITSLSIEKLYFNGINGANPYGSLIQGTDGMLYAMTDSGGIYNKGVLFQYDPVTSAYTKKLDFDGVNGSYPKGTLMQASNGMLYGMTFMGGANNRGVLFQYNPITSIYTKKLDYTDSNGSHPVYTNLIEIHTAFTTSALKTTQCAGNFVSVSYSKAGAFNIGNIFTAQLSDATGSFASPVTIGTLTATVSGTINAVIPMNTPSGNGYRVRVVSSNPTLTASDNGGNITIHTLPLPIVTAYASVTTVCAGTTVTLTGAGASFYSWSGSITNGVGFSVTATTTYTVVGTDANGCNSTAIKTITVNPLPVVSLILNPDSVCTNHAPYVLAGGSPGGGIYSGKDVSANMFNPGTAGIGFENIIYTYTDANSCPNSSMAKIYISACTGIESIFGNRFVHVFPNPTSGAFNLQIEQPESLNTKIELFNVLGEKIYGISNGQWIRDNGNTSMPQSLTINISCQPAGVYFLHLKTSDGDIVKKIIKE